ncbi:dethiobiotin synthase [Idiomarina loihiensis]|jgi:dethiobiotin synthetase|uniref:ATP-dependent dethiobiotin synthetase BioD n=1 Tax=Idiomarina loihiensis (strain ATCC BAA-735 / DSM 15497 / L2-TR) TaxID=283942 RepID=BIOD_IDILO|nr:dethiobiotin synthase [Idiomarina loihiensis]Q5QZ19.1 RecName: Full=ATP-dependent dethiobiotin synthetase BioD; AltName: Full=DTB synthetase; Short=DTBS; AltName: Full=Dethiobiotin synthase [Idiomarina loihiensis L2TR]AAV82161.1 Dethiobiotin synthetase [Idiomarina loihiensis L2TR]AGM36191.1 dethiobiotin synthetase [Idiomarina loihiensis GSL 199]MBL4857099.1 dethiobiotin synthase [Idiomarina sp.]
MNTYFIAGTDTDAGKTVAACAFVQYLVKQSQQVAVMKPVASGCHWQNGQLVNEDALNLMRQSNTSFDYDRVNPYTFEAAIAPHIAAADSGVVIDKERLLKAVDWFHERPIDSLVIEGAGGWQLPLASGLRMPQVVKEVNAKVVLVVGLKLGCLNHALLSLQSIKQEGCDVAGWIAVQTGPEPMPRQAENLASLRELLDEKELASIPYLPGWTEEDLSIYFHK